MGFQFKLTGLLSTHDLPFLSACSVDLQRQQPYRECLMSSLLHKHNKFLLILTDGVLMDTGISDTKLKQVQKEQINDFWILSRWLRLLQHQLQLEWLPVPQSTPMAF